MSTCQHRRKRLQGKRKKQRMEKIEMGLAKNQKFKEMLLRRGEKAQEGEGAPLPSHPRRIIGTGIET